MLHIQNFMAYGFYFHGLGANKNGVYSKAQEG
jgi:hypothetical protein